MRLHLFLLPALAAALTAQTPPPAAEPELVATLTEENFKAWQRHILPAAGEEAWAELPWLMSFHEGLQAAAKARKPLLLWTMNGHPFGCT